MNYSLPNKISTDFYFDAKYLQNSNLQIQVLGGFGNFGNFKYKTKNFISYETCKIRTTLSTSDYTKDMNLLQAYRQIFAHILPRQSGILHWITAGIRNMSGKCVNSLRRI